MILPVLLIMTGCWIFGHNALKRMSILNFGNAELIL